ncbi:type IV pilus inner membrane component PilO [Larsenimonas rhizosphaerae]|uniref:Type 4a pilus biogenesis protein PilO n=1 Tax=Larsenimonas rhizosphaerae TaxID=2944682 RepID=A0AA41ZM57_9GAMM|nr:type 4a pilus biogenesis protein PilO [Larsenimonas rhizosphaerae]MCX2524368.1 type 4a pilus biogenesis protein PilO [Larsenimonas rhizosphaerae]
MRRQFWHEQWRAIRAMEASDLDLSNAGSWPRLLKALVCMVIALLSWWAAHQYLVHDVDRLIQSNRAREEQLMSSYELRAFQAANLPLLSLQMRQLDQQMASLVSMLPSGAELPALIDDVSDLAHEHALTIDFIRLQDPQQHDFYIEQPFMIQVQGQYHHLAAFVAGVSSLSRIVTLHDFTLSPVSVTADAQQGVASTIDPLLILNVQARTYRHDKALAGTKEGT